MDLLSLLINFNVNCASNILHVIIILKPHNEIFEIDGVNYTSRQGLRTLIWVTDQCQLTIR